MIAARELRIGNWVYHHHNLDIKIPAILTIGLDIHSYQEFEPISLTEEILLKCGFEKVENNWKCLHINFGTISWERLAGLTFTLEYESVYLPHIKYLHQLQNLYFILTGEELEVKL